MIIPYIILNSPKSLKAKESNQIILTSAQAPKNKKIWIRNLQIFVKKGIFKLSIIEQKGLRDILRDIKSDTFGISLSNYNEHELLAVVSQKPGSLKGVYVDGALADLEHSPKEIEGFFEEMEEEY